jgi:hypothetical protein
MTKEQKLLYDQVVNAFMAHAPSDLMNTPQEIGAHEQHWLLAKTIHRALKQLNIHGFYQDIEVESRKSID